MHRKTWLDLGASLLVALGIVGSTYLAKVAAPSGAWVLAGPLLLAFAVLAADGLRSRLGGRPSRPSPAGWMLAGAIVLASGIVALRDPILVKTLLPTLGVTCWVPLLLGSGNAGRPCRSLR